MAKTFKRWPKRCPPADNWCTSDIKTIKTSFLWTINNFSKCTEKTGEWMKSSTFSGIEDTKTKWYLMLYPNGDKEEKKECISVFLYLQSSDRKEVLTDFNISLIDGNDNVHKKLVPSVTIFSSTSPSWGFTNGFKRSELMDSQNHLLTDDRLTIHCEVKYTVDRQTISGKKITFKRRRNSLLDDMTALYENLNECDVDIEVNGHKFTAHKAILMARSPVFASMFEHKMKEREQNKVIIKDIDREVFSKVLRFLYTDKVINDNIESNMKLLSAADKYILNDLMSICEEYLSSQLSVVTAADILILADNHSAEQLKTKAIDFIKANPLGVMKTKGWMKVIRKQHLLEII